jgi:hypothetical protein
MGNDKQVIMNQIKNAIEDIRTFFLSMDDYLVAEAGRGKCDFILGKINYLEEQDVSDRKRVQQGFL